MKINIIKAWKDEEYRSTLTAEQLQTIDNPVASLKLSDEQMETVNGGTGSGVTFNTPPNKPSGVDDPISFSDCCAVF